MSDIGRLGYLEIINETQEDLKIFTQNNIQIENITVTSQSTFGLSIIGGNGGSYNYLLPQNNYELNAKTLSGDVVASRQNVHVMELYNTTWTISDTLEYMNLLVQNNLQETITIHDKNNNLIYKYTNLSKKISKLILSKR